MWNVEGSSPRMRGTQRQFWYYEFSHGIIPAHAGNTYSLPTASVFHPGSSPRMRGTLAWLSSSNLLDRDHPRACGEHLLC